MDYEDEPRLDGPKFCRLSSQLPRYDGAVRRRMESEMADEGTGDSHVRYELDNVNVNTGQTMTMKEAVARGKGDSDGVLHALNQEHSRSQFGALFEYEVG